MHKNSTGFTLIELMLVLAIAGILLGMAVPSFSNMISSSKISGAAERLKNEIEWARTEAVKENQDVTVYFTSGSSWCIGLDDNSDGDGACNCSGTTCQVNSQQKVVSSALFNDTSLAVNVAGNTFTVDSRGLADNAGDITISNADYSAKLTFSLLGRATICSDNISKYPSC